jgi:hypothetical protein
VTPAAAIAMLDKQLAEHGQDAVLTRSVGGSPATVTVRARFLGHAVDELAAGVGQIIRDFVMSPSQIAAAPTWAGGGAEPIWPRIGDKITVDGRRYEIEATGTVSVGGTVVRINGKVRG